LFSSGREPIPDRRKFGVIQKFRIVWLREPRHCINSDATTPASIGRALSNGCLIPIVPAPRPRKGTILDTSGRTAGWLQRSQADIPHLAALAASCSAWTRSFHLFSEVVDKVWTTFHSEVRMPAYQDVTFDHCCPVKC
jgi:hypothetical protein